MNQKIVLGLGVLLGLLFTGVAAISWVGSERAIHPELTFSGHRLSQFDLPVENVRFKTRDDLTLSGWFIPGANGATVILVHGKDGGRDEMLPHADYLHKNSFSTLLYDSRNRGESVGGRTCKEGTGRGQPATRGLNCQKVHQPGTAIPRSHPGGQYRFD